MLDLASQHLGVVVELNASEHVKHVHAFSHGILLPADVAGAIQTEHWSQAQLVGKSYALLDVLHQIIHEACTVIVEITSLPDAGLLYDIGSLATFEHTTTPCGVEASGDATPCGLGASIVPAKGAWCKV